MDPVEREEDQVQAQGDYAHNHESYVPIYQTDRFRHESLLSSIITTYKHRDLDFAAQRVTKATTKKKIPKVIPVMAIGSKVL